MASQIASHPAASRTLSGVPDETAGLSHSESPTGEEDATQLNLARLQGAWTDLAGLIGERKCRSTLLKTA